MKKTIEMKIAKNGAKLYYRVDENGNKTRVAYKDCYMELAWQAHDNYEAECEANRKAQIDVIDDYAINPDAFQVAVNAEIQNANNVKINDLKWEIRYIEGSINDLDKNHIAHAPNDQSLQERRAELVNELAALKAQLAEIEPDTTELSDEEIAEIKRRSQINAIKSRIATYERAIERQYDQELENSLIAAKAQLADLLPNEIQVADNEADTTEPDEPKFQVGKSYYIKDGDSYYILKVEARNDKMLTGTTPHGTCKYHIHDTFKGEYIRTHLYDDCGNREMIWAANEYKPQVDPIIQERETARNEYDQLNAVRKVIENDVEKFERLRDRCKPNSPKHKEYNQLLADFDPIIRAFGDKFIAAQDRYNNSLTLRTDEEKAATQKAVDEHNKDLDARGIKYFATVYYYPNGVEGEDMETFCKDCTSLDEANAFVSQDDHDGVYVGGIYDAGWEITDRNHYLIADHITGIKEDFKTTTNTIAAKAVTSVKGGDDYDDRRFGTARYGRYSRWLCLRVRPAAAPFKAYSATFRRILPSRR